jgi:hypothetical protein
VAVCVSSHPPLNRLPGRLGEASLPLWQRLLATAAVLRQNIFEARLRVGRYGAASPRLALLANH